MRGYRKVLERRGGRFLIPSEGASVEENRTDAVLAQYWRGVFVQKRVSKRVSSASVHTDALGMLIIKDLHSLRQYDGIRSANYSYRSF